jgi:hypothetical protein
MMGTKQAVKHLTAVYVDLDLEKLESVAKKH